MAGDHRNTSNINKKFLIEELKLEQLTNTTIFTKEELFVLSPAIDSINNRFDLRKINLDKFSTKYKKGYLLIRFKKILLLTELDKFIKECITEEKHSNTKNSGVHWKFIVTVTNEIEPQYFAKCRTNGKYFKVDSLEKDEIKKILQKQSAFP